MQRAAEVLELAGSPLRGARVLVAGLAYKANVADARESPAIWIISVLRRPGASVSVYDPLVGCEDGELLVSLEDPVTVRAYDPELFSGARLILDAACWLRNASNRFVP